MVKPELTSENSIGADSLEPGQVWTLSPGGMDKHAGLYRIEVDEGPGSGLHILNKPAPPAFQESVRYAQQNLYACAAQLAGDRDPRAHEFSVQLRGFDAAKSGSQVGVGALIALCSSLLKQPLRGGVVVIGEINLGGFHRTDPQRRHAGRDGRQEGDPNSADAGVEPPAAFRPLRRHGDQRSTRSSTRTPGMPC